MKGGIHMKGAKGGGTKKIGRNKDKCAKYRLKQHGEKNKVRKYKKLIKGLPVENIMRIGLEKKIKELEKKII